MANTPPLSEVPVKPNYVEEEPSLLSKKGLSKDDMVPGTNDHHTIIIPPENQYIKDKSQIEDGGIRSIIKTKSSRTFTI